MTSVIISTEWLKANTWKPSAALKKLPIETQIEKLCQLMSVEKNTTKKDSMAAYRGYLLSKLKGKTTIVCKSWK